MEDLCNRCGEFPKVPGFKRCQDCIDYFRNWKKENRIAHLDKCTSCGMKRDTEAKTCSKCLKEKQDYYQDVSKEQRKEVKEFRKDNNICIGCGKEEQSNETCYCGKCLEKQKIERKARKLDWEARQLCNNCGNPKETLLFKRCAYCTKHARRTILRRKIKVLTAYGGCCQCCGETQLEFLSIDHINGGGILHRKTISSLYQWLIKNHFPEGFRVLCINCNTGRSRNNRADCGGKCSHKDTHISHNNLLITPYVWNIACNGKSNRKSELKLKFHVLEKYGAKCQCCGVNQYEFLSIDHIKGGGNQHVKSIVGNIYSWLVKNNYPKDFRAMCMSCNQGRSINGGICPHKCDIVSSEEFLMTKSTYDALNFIPTSI